MTTAPLAPTEEARVFARRIGAAIDRSPGPVHAVLTAVELLRAAGFEPLVEEEAWTAPPDRWYVVRGGALVAGVAPPTGTDGGFRIVGAHTDSPTLRIKPRPDTGTAGFRQLGVEVYGSALLNSWLDRDLGLSGQVAVLEGQEIRSLPLVIDRPMLRIPQLAIHLDGEIRDRGLKLDAQRHLAPVWGLGDPREGDLRDHLAEHLGVAPESVVTWDLGVHDLTPATLAGGDEEFLVSGRLDDLCSVFCAVEALTQRLATAAPLEHEPVLCFFDHEEVGSVSASGAGSELLPGVLGRLAAGRGIDPDTHAAALARSVCISADMAHATHPNHADRHEPEHPIACNAGPVIKLNANQRYATDARGAAEVVRACRAASVPHQQFVSRSDLPCGSTIGPITAGRLGVPTVDVGIAQLAMHSCRETAGSLDPLLLSRMLSAFF
jgi:aspartyl aminopeptidase